jgi:hypothetical protein
MRLTLRVTALAALAALTATVLLFRPGSVPTVAAAQPQAAADDLALVPSDAVAFIHVRAADLWKNEVFAGFRQTFEKAGPKALAALDAQFVPKISTFDRLTGFLLMDGEKKEPLPFVILRFSAPFSSAEVIKAYLSGAEEMKLPGGKSYWASKNSDFELYFPDKQTIMVTQLGATARYLSHQAPKTGGVSYGLKLAASGKPVVAAVNFSALPLDEIKKGLKDLPTEALPLLKAEHLTAALDLGARAKVDVVAGYKNASDAQDAEKAIKALADMARKELAKVKADIEKKLFEAKSPGTLHDVPEAVFSVFALGAINQVDELLANPGALVKRTGSELTASIPLPKEVLVGSAAFVAVGVGLLVPAVQKVRMAAGRVQSQNNLKQIAIACHAYMDANGHMPHDIVDKTGKPILSWRVALLPYLEQDNLYKQFKFDEPWDGPNNKKWSQVAVKVFMSPQADPPTPPGMTHYKALVGPGTAFEPGKPLKLPADFPDGTSNTILVVEAGDPVPWAKPEDIPFDPKKPAPKLALPGVPDLVNVALVDGSVRTLNVKKLSETTLKNAIIRNDGNPLGEDWGQ